MLKIESFCYGIPLKCASMIYAVLNFTISLFYPLISFVMIMSDKYLCKIPGNYHHCHFFMIATLITLVLSFVPLILNVILLVGIFKEKSNLIKIYIYIEFFRIGIIATILILLGLFCTLMISILSLFITLLLLGIFIPIPCYFIITLYSLACELDEKDKVREEYAEVNGTEMNKKL